MTLALHDAGMAGLWWIITWLVARSAFRLCKQAFPDQSLSSDILVTTVLTVGAIHLSLVSMGAAGLFTPWAVWPVAMILAGLSWMVTRRARRRSTDTGAGNSARGPENPELSPHLRPTKSRDATRSRCVRW